MSGNARLHLADACQCPVPSQFQLCRHQTIGGIGRVVLSEGAIGGHDAASRQLLVVVRGRVSVRTRDAGAELRGREAVEWEAEEWHESRSLEPSLVLLVEGDFEPFA